MKSNASIEKFSSVAVCEPQQEASPSDPILEKMKAMYQADQQVKFLDLQAETDSLLQTLRELKQQRMLTEQGSH